MIRDSHETPKLKQAHLKRAWQLFRALLERKIIEFIEPAGRSSLSPREERVGREPERGVSDHPASEFSTSSPLPSPPLGAESRVRSSDQSLLTSATTGQKLRVNVELQDDFSMDQTLSLYLHDTIPLLDPQAPDYALDLLTLVESILENPDIILRRQLDRVKDQKMAEMKQEGIEYDQRMEELEKLEYPKPRREFIYTTFDAFADYIKDYELQRAEGVLLRHLNSVYKALAQTVPDAAKNDAVRELELYLITMIRQVDSSLLDEWEKLRDPSFQRAENREIRPPGAEAAATDITRDVKAFAAAIRLRVFAFLRGWVNQDFEQALTQFASSLDADGPPWTPQCLREALVAYHAEHRYLCLDPNARNVRHTYVVPSEDQRLWRVQQMLVDPDEHNDWVAEFEVDLAESRTAGEPVLRLRRIASLT